jgi:hypothetical protein
VKITYEINIESKIIFVKAKGIITVNDLIENEKKIMNDPHFESNLNTLVDFTHAKPADNVNFQSIDISRQFVESIQQIRGKCKWAFIAPNDAAYGVSRMFSMLSNGLSIESEVFRSEEEAKKWLGLK